ncbi:MAG: hypothetical protein Q9181_003353, partial [Wetmoreana brouardii]
IHHSGHSVGIPKPLLITCYLHAHSIFFSATAAQDEKYQATSVILLFDANHLTACNFRKRWLLGWRDAWLQRCGVDKWEERGEKEIEEVVRGEFMWVESLVTSPLFRHAKSSTLWAHRLWILRSFPDTVSEGRRDTAAERLETELEIVMKAGERHPRNYYAWAYAREVVRFLSCRKESNGEYAGGGMDKGVWKHSMRMVHECCLGHPRDMSGWSFLVFMVDQKTRLSQCGKDSYKTEIEETVRDIFRTTQQFIQKYDWKGESIEWFMRAAERFHIDSSD